MELKSLILKGFKTFADKVELLFEPVHEEVKGITAIVGPNGCGKSNLVDAFRWVIGETNPKNLRGDSQKEIIFAGTPLRKALSLAEVTLTFDNSSGKLNLPVSEVSVSRRIFRSGESEFLINKKACRLKDIRDLFWDTGIGGGSYSFMTQGQVDAILSSKPEERRSFFEEAAGISKYKVRKETSQRKLFKVEQNLKRVGDLKLEIAKEVERLKFQSEAAQKYINLRSEVKRLQMGIGRRLADSIKTKEDSSRQRVQEFLKELESLSLKIKEKEEEKKSLRDRFSLIDKEIEEFHTAEFSSQEIEELKSQIFEDETFLGKVRNDLRELATQKELALERIKRDKDMLNKFLEEKEEIEEKISESALEVVDFKDSPQKNFKEELGDFYGHIKEMWMILEREAFPLAVTYLKDKEHAFPLEKLKLAQSSAAVAGSALLDSLKERKDKVQSEIDLLERSKSLQEGEINRIKEEDARLNKVKLEKEKHLLELRRSLEESQKKLFAKTQGLHQEKSTLLNKIEAIEEEILAAQTEERRLRDRLSSEEVRLTRVEAEVSALFQHLFDEYKITAEEIEKSEVEIKNLNLAKAEVQKMKQEIFSLEPVNLLAIEEYSKSRERLNFIEKQSGDLEESQRNLQELIIKLDHEAKDTFLSCIEEVGKNFSEIFGVLFEGGEARIKLSHPELPLESGIEIEARPAGRGWNSLALLSGGERSLTAVALLFALLKRRPSPFCFLDEVDAALDDANTNRFNRMLKEFSKKTQIIVITHNKNTMASADTLYGVTMEEAGVSRLISVKMKHPEPVASPI